MDLATAATYIARSEARRIRPLRSVEDLDEQDEAAFEGRRRLPAFRVDYSTDPGRGRQLVATPLSGRDPGHDNAPRLSQVCDYLTSSVLPLVEPGCAAGVRGHYRIELHDSYTYLPDRHAYDNVFSFGRDVDACERNVALLPDPYHMDNFGGGRLVSAASADPVRWQDKDPVMLFAGTTTGDRDPSRNARLRACAWAAGERSGSARMHITSVAQMSLADIQACYPQQVLASVFRPPVPLEEHFRHRWVANIVGNTACWSRVPMIMSSGSLMVHVRHKDATWYYPLLREGRHYAAAQSVEPEDLQRALSFCHSYDRQCKQMVSEANALARDLFGSTAVINTYACELLQECAHLGAP